MDTKQPNALRLADALGRAPKWQQLQAAAKLRRQHAEIEMLRSKLKTLEDLGPAGDDVQILRMGYAAARLEIESLQARLQELGQMARECSDRKVVQLESALARHVRSGKDWAMRVEALERTITTLRAHIASLNAQVAAEKKAMRELEAQVAAVGAGGVEPLRKRECLHQIAEPAPSEWDVRGHLAESLTCWCRLTGQEAAELVALFQGRPEQADAPVVLPAPDAVLRFERSTAGKENEMPIVVSCNWLPDGEYKLYTEQQVRAMLATGEANRKPDCTPQLHVGESRFESWYAQEYDKGWGTQKQLARDAYAAGMGDTSAQADARDAVKSGEVLVTVSGLTGCGKSAIAGEIEILCRALGLQVQWHDSDSEKNMTHADWTTAVEQYKPRVRIVERNVPIQVKEVVSK